MIRLFLSSHGHLATGMKSALEVLLGNADQLTVFDAYIDERSVQSALDDFYLYQVQNEDQVILLSDVYGGSVNTTMMQYLNHENTTLISGAHLGLILELVLLPEAISKERLEELVESSKKGIKMVELDDTPIVEEEFF